MYMAIKIGSNNEEQVKAIQARLGIEVDGIFGKETEDAVKKFQSSHNLSVDGVVGIKTWKALNVCKRYINMIIVHCAATPEGKDIKTETIRDWHVNGNGWKDIGYHYVVELDGKVCEGRPEDEIGSHCSGKNKHSIGVCYVGGCAVDGKTPKDTRTPAQKTSLLNLLKCLKKRYPGAKIYGHRDFSSKACPSFDAKSEYKDL